MTDITFISPSPIILNRKRGKKIITVKKVRIKNKAMTVKTAPLPSPGDGPRIKPAMPKAAVPKSIRTLGTLPFLKSQRAEPVKKDSKKNFSKQPPLS